MATTITRREQSLLVEAWPETLHPRLQEIYASRGIEKVSELERSLQAMLRPQQLKGLTDAISLLVEAKDYLLSAILMQMAQPVLRWVCWRYAIWGLQTYNTWCLIASILGTV